MPYPARIVKHKPLPCPAGAFQLRRYDVDKDQRTATLSPSSQGLRQHPVNWCNWCHPSWCGSRCDLQDVGRWQGLGVWVVAAGVDGDNSWQKPRNGTPICHAGMAVAEPAQDTGPHCYSDAKGQWRTPQVRHYFLIQISDARSANLFCLASICSGFQTAKSASSLVSFDA